MTLFGQISLGLGAFLAVHILYHTVYFLKRRLGLRVILLALTVLLLSALPLTYQKVGEYRNTREARGAVQLFQKQYPGAQLMRVSRLPDSWAYNYINDGKEHLVIKAGNAWITVPLPVTGTPVASP